MEASSGKSDANAASAHCWIELISDPVLLCDEAGFILRANRPALVLFSVKSSRYAGIPVQSIISTKSRDHFLWAWEHRSSSIYMSDSERLPVWVRSSKKRPIPTWMTIDEVGPFGQPQFALVFKDAPISYSPDGLRETDLSEHLSSIRHEIRSPLSGIKVMTDVLLRNKPGNLDDAQIDQLTAIRNAASNLASLIDNIDVPEVVPVDRTA